MAGEIDYRNMALDCIREADGTDDPVIKRTLLAVAKLYNQTALAVEIAKAAPVQAAQSVLSDRVS